MIAQPQAIRERPKLAAEHEPDYLAGVAAFVPDWETDETREIRTLLDRLRRGDIPADNRDELTDNLLTRAANQQRLLSAQLDTHVIVFKALLQLAYDEQQANRLAIHRHTLGMLQEVTGYSISYLRELLHGRSKRTPRSRSSRSTGSG